jgi:phosphate transport system substrate-binding protein
MSKKIATYCGTAALAGAIILHLSPAIPVHAETLKIGGTGAALGTMRVLADSYTKSRSSNVKFIFVPGLGSGGGKKALSAGAIDIALTSKAGNDAEKLEGAKAVLYGKTPFVFATSIKNSASGLTTQDLVDIWSGKTLQWHDGARLRLILRPESDSDTEMLKRISLAMAQAVKIALSREGIRVTMTDGETADALESTQGALGTSVLALIISEKRSLKPLALDGVAPTAKNIADGSYPYFKSLYALARTNPTGPAEDFMGFLQSQSARKILAELGYWMGEGTP